MFRTTEPFDFRAWRDRMGLNNSETADILCVDRKTLYTWIKAGEAPALAVKHARLLERLKTIA